MPKHVLHLRQDIARAAKLHGRPVPVLLPNALRTLARLA